MRFLAIIFFLLPVLAHAVNAPTGFGNPSQYSQKFNPAWTAQQWCTNNFATSTQLGPPRDSTASGSGNVTADGVVYTQRLIPGVGVLLDCRNAAGTNLGIAGQIAYCVGSTPAGASPYTCPTCPVGTIEVSGKCEIKITCPVAGTSKSAGMYLLGPDPLKAIPNVACDASCETTYTGDGITKRATVNGVFQYYYGLGGYAYTGSQCSGGATSPPTGSVPPNTCNPATQDAGIVNGVSVCINKTTTDTSDTIKTAPVTNPDGSTSTTSTTTSTNASNNTTTTKTTTTTTATDGKVTTTESSVTSPTAPPDSFCSKNPTDPSCLKNSEFCKNNPETLACSTMGTVEDSVLTKKEFSISSIAPVSVGNAGTCPAPLTTTFLGKPVEFSFDPLCKYADSLRPLVLALAWLAAGVIFIGGVKN